MPRRAVQLHGDLPLNIGEICQAESISAMKTKMTKPNPAEEKPPCLTRHERHGEGMLPAFVLHLLKQADKALAQRKLCASGLAALSPEVYDAPLNINVFEWQASLTQAATLLPSHEK